MELRTALGLVPFTTDPTFQKHFNEMLSDRIRTLTDRLISSDDPEKMRVIQGSLRELKLLLNLNLDVTGRIENEKKRVR